jgi:RNA polymerase sigma-70 factor, ECF subfamily
MPAQRGLIPVDHAKAQQLGDFRQQLLRFALRRLRDADRAEDAVQDTLLSALEGIDRFGGGSSLGTWLIGILKHKIADALRRPVREEALDGEQLASHDHDPERDLARMRLLDAVDAGLRRLPPCAARVFVMRQVLGMELAEVSQELSISPANCSVMDHRARARLRRRLADAL